MYVVLCKDNSLYTGITKDLQRRIDEHNYDSVKRAKAIRGKLPVNLVYWELFENESNAKKREYAVKSLSREQKLILIQSKKGPMVQR